MNEYVIKIYLGVDKKDKDAKPKIKTIVCSTDAEMFTCIQNSINEKYTYEVYKAQLELVLQNRETVA